MLITISYVVYLGCYCLMKLGTDLINFREYPEEADKLNAEILEAKEDLKKILGPNYR